MIGSTSSTTTHQIKPDKNQQGGFSYYLIMPDAVKPPTLSQYIATYNFDEESLLGSGIKRI